MILAGLPAPWNGGDEGAAGDDALVHAALPGAGFFLENAGQIARTDVRYYAASGAATFGFARSAVLVNLAGGAGGGVLVRIHFEGSNPVDPVGRGEEAHRTSAFLGADPSGWRTGLRSYREVAFPNLYDGIELRYRMDPRGAKYEFTVEPGADVGQPRLRFEGSESVRIEATGDLVVRTTVGEIRDTRPIALQRGRPVPCRFTLTSESVVGVSCPTRDSSETLVIDPLVYATFLGGGDRDDARAVVVDAAGSAYVTGSTRSPDFPVTPGAYNTTYEAMDDVFVAKLDPSGQALVYATYIGGSGIDVAVGIAVSGGSAYVTGQTDSNDFPTTPGAMDRILNGADAFVAKVGPSGDALEYSTFLGGDIFEIGRSVAVDPAGNAYVVGDTASANFPTTPGAMDTSFGGPFTDGFLVKLNPAGSALVFGTFLGGATPAVNLELAYDVAVDANGSAFVVGITNTVDFPTTAGAYQGALNGVSDGFVTKFLPDGTGLIFGTYLGGGTGDAALTIAIDPSGAAYVGGTTDSVDFPVTPGAFDLFYGGSTDGFVAKLAPTGDGVAYATYLGGPREELLSGVTVDGDGQATVAGQTNSTAFPTTAGAANETYRGGVYDAFVTRLNATGSGLAYSTFVGGSGTDIPYGLAADTQGNAIVTGLTNSTNFPVTAGAYDTGFSGGAYDAFVAKVGLTFPLALDSVPSGLQVEVDGVPATTPFVASCNGGSTVTVHAPSPQVASQTRWALLSWSDGGSQTHTVACAGPASLTATFVATDHEITVTTSPPNLQIVLDGVPWIAPQSFWWGSGSNHTLEAPSPHVGAGTQHLFLAWSDGGARSHSVNVTGPATYTASFGLQYNTTVTSVPGGLAVELDGTAVPSPLAFWCDAGAAHNLSAPSPQGSGPIRHTFDSWSDGGAQTHGIVCMGPATFTARFVAEYETRVDTVPPGLQVVVGGTPYTAPHVRWCPDGTSLSLNTPSPQAAGTVRYVFQGWSDAGAQAHDVVCTQPVNYTAVFGTEYQVTITTAPPGLEVTVDAMTATAPVSAWWPAGSLHDLSAPTPQGTGDTRSAFALWSDGGPRTHNVTATGPITYTATFGAEHRVVIESSPAGRQAVVDSVLYALPQTFWWLEGSPHSVVAPSPQSVTTGERFVWRSWSDDGGQSHSFVVTGPRVLTATFVQQFFLTLTSAYGGVSCSVASCWYDAGTSAIARATVLPTGPPGVQYRFSGWTGDNASNLIQAPVFMDRPKSMTATWVVEHFLQVISVYGPATGTGWFAEGVSAPFAVTARESTVGGQRYRFVRWTGDVSTDALTGSILMDGPKTIEATWEEVGLLEEAWVWLLPLIVAVILVLFFLWRRRKRRPEDSPDGEKAVDEESSADLEHELDLHGRPEG